MIPLSLSLLLGHMGHAYIQGSSLWSRSTLLDYEPIS